MKTLILLLLFCLGSVSLPGNSDAELYKWVDEKGVLHFGDTPPANGKTTVEALPTRPQDDVDIVPTIPEPRQPKKATRQPQTHAKKSALCENSEVELYTTSWCSYCQKAREFFDERGVVFIEYDIETDQDAAQQKQELDGLPGVPFALINGQPVHGFLPSAYEKALTQCPD
jgi:glutaredoxin